jgi:HK97 family phage major capsid protein
MKTRAELEAIIKRLKDEAAAISKRLTEGNGSDADLERVDKLDTELRDAQEELKTLDDGEREKATRAAAARERIAAIVGGGSGTGGGTAVLDDESRRERREPEQRQRVERIAEQFVASEQMRSYAERGFTGQVAVDFPDVDVRTLIDSTGVGFNGSRNPYVGTIDPTPDAPLRVLDLIDRQSTGLSSVPYLIEGANPGAAAEVAEGAAKPEAAFTFTEAEAPVRTIAHWVPITRQAAEDNATLVGYVEGRLSYGLDLRLNAQVLAGNGTAPNLRGIINTTGVGTYTPGGAEARIITVRKAITIAQLSEYQPDTVVLHPNDWQSVELDTDTAGQFRVSTVANGAPPRLWGLGVVVTTAITTATYLVGAFRLGATLWERSGIRLLMSDSHGTNFTANIIVLLAEMRAALTVWRPAAFVKGGFV